MWRGNVIVLSSVQSWGFVRAVLYLFPAIGECVAVCVIFLVHFGQWQLVSPTRQPMDALQNMASLAVFSEPLGHVRDMQQAWETLMLGHVARHGMAWYSSALQALLLFVSLALYALATITITLWRQ